MPGEGAQCRCSSLCQMSQQTKPLTAASVQSALILHVSDNMPTDFNM